jgi:hypothetical protein
VRIDRDAPADLGACWSLAIHPRRLVESRRRNLDATRSLALSLSRSLALSLCSLVPLSFACVADDSDGLDDATLEDEDDSEERGGILRSCPTCKYKSSVTFSGLPTGTLTSAQMEVTVKHSGTCPQSGPTNCTEKLVYNVVCQLGTSSTKTFPFFIDAASTVTSHTAKITVVKAGTTTTHTGTVDLNSNVTGGAAPPSSIPTPCAPPTIDPYTNLPTLI